MGALLMLKRLIQSEGQIATGKLLFCYALLIGASALFLIPLLWTLSVSLTPKGQVILGTFNWIPDPIAWENYYLAVTNMPFMLYLYNTLVITVLSIIGVVFSCTAVAYAFGCLQWPGRDTLFVVMLATMMIPPQVLMIPVFILFCRLGWYDSFKPLIVPAFIGGNAFFIFLLRQFYKTLPTALFDSARIDGCSVFGIYWRIVLPLTKSALAAVVIFTLNGVWNDFLGPLIYINSEAKKTLALGVQAFSAQSGAEASEMMAVSTLMILPLLLVFFLGQRYFIEGITLTGLKG